MNIRVTPDVVASQTILYAQRQTDTLAHLQEEASTGLKLLRPSDGPGDTVTVMANKAQDLRLDTYLGNIQGARATLDLGVSALREVTDILAQARGVAIEGSNAINDASSNEALAQQIDGLFNRLLNTANTQNAGRYLFGGTAIQAAPFTVSASGQVTYTGAEEAAQALVGPQQTVATFYPGDQIFQQRQRGVTLYTGSTGAAAGTGTDSATGQGTLTVTHTSTSYQAGSGVKPGTGSAAGDTIIGPAGAHRLNVVDTSGNGSAGTISLDNGAPVAFTNAATNLKVAGPTGEVVYVDTTAISPGFIGSVDVTANGNLSVDGGASQVGISFTGNQVITNIVTGAATNVDSTNIRTAGTEQLSYAGTADAFQVLSAIRNDLRNKNLADAQRSQSLSSQLADLDRVRTGVLNVVGAQSTTLANLDALEKRTQDVQLELRKQNSGLESADMSQVVVSLQAQQNLLQATLASGARINNISLVDFLR